MWILIKLKSLCLLALFLTLSLDVNGESLKEGHDPRDVTFWDFKEKSLYFASPRNVGINSTLVDWGLTIPNGTVGVPCSEGDECYDYGVAKVVVTVKNNCQTINWTTTDLTELKDCINLLGHWYGGGAQYSEPWPIENNPRLEVAFVTGDSGASPLEYGGVTESYWISSVGVAVRVEDSVPLFLSLPDHDKDGVADQMCFSSKFESPFVALDDGAPLSLLYHICTADDIRQVYDTSYPKFFDKPYDIPDERMFTYPIWSTWAEYFKRVDDAKVIEFAQMIIDRGFNNSQIEIDDNWETCYGEHIFDPVKFPDPKGMVDTLHAMGFRVTLWIHPFINSDCDIFAFADQNGFFLKNATGQTQLTNWWDTSRRKGAGLIDFTNNDALTWWSLRLNALRSQTGIDSFKFDAGETSYMPEDYTLSLEKQYWPNGFTTAYVNTVTDFGNFIEVRVAYSTQQEPIFVRMLDKDSYWANTNGLRTLIPSLLHSGLIGYPFVLPDMIGGNAYTGKPSTELYIRWAQANTFMPTMQFSLLPWDFDDGTVSATNASLAVSALHAQYAPLIIELARNTTLGEGPMMRPTWWLCPTEEDCLLADQQFLLGDDILVTPVVYEGATSLEVVFPPGSWKRVDTGTNYDGVSKQTIDGITLESNIYFTRV